MVNLFLRAANNDATTTNGAAALHSSLDDVVDLFFKIGASRGKFKELEPTLARAYAANPEWTIRVLLWARDVRGGAGERQLFRDAIAYLHKHGCLDEDSLRRISARVPELGRWDDLFIFFDTAIENTVLNWITTKLVDGDGLCAKWMPREKNNPIIARKIMRYMGWSPKQYRKRLVEATKVVETQMCDNKWTEIEYGKVPSLASARYQKAFGRHDTAGYTAYLESLKKGEAKINAGAVYPYDVVKSVVHGNAQIANEQWKALPNFLEGDKSRTICVVDVSGSMTMWNFGNSFSSNVKMNFSPLDVAVSLGLYLSERMEGPFKDHFYTFESCPKLIRVKGTLSQKVEQMKESPWGGSTNLDAVFDHILTLAMSHELSDDDLPEQILILSDMQFNGCVRFTAYESMKAKYAAAGYKMPKVVFWNINSHSNVPVSFDQKGTALVSGFSPSIMRAILKGNTEDFTPLGIMKNTILVERYNF